MRKLLYLLIFLLGIIIISSCSTEHSKIIKKIEKNNVEHGINLDNSQGSSEIITPIELSNQPNL